jgi:beta-galactosidase
VGVDFVFPTSVSLADYSVILVPPLYISDDALLQRLADYVKNGGHLITAFKSGFCNEYSTVRSIRMPGPLREAAGLSYQEFSTLKQPVGLKGDPFGLDEQNRVSTWAEMLLPETAKALAYYDHPFFGQFPALTRNTFGKGTLTYEGTVLTDALQGKVIAEVLDLAGLTGPDQDLPTPVRMRQGMTSSGKVQRFYLNFSGQSQTFAYPHADGTELLTGKPVRQSQSVMLGPWDLAIIEEQ